ncbi:hemerythrin domain-containing protein [Sulfurimonas sp.]|uniref:bacteriohemerythrin n=1 Tax=Sulfurimonas sp. TaxID=2022749 RepID=UPI002B48DE35|nr:hemerythrin domain-containing protein [Sulfurimonas sp.]
MNGCDTMEWMNVYSLGDSKIDSEHKKLFELAVVIEECKDNKNQLELAVKTLVKYTKFHFRSEEIYMRELEYEKLAEHISIHKQIVESLNQIVLDMSKNSQDRTYELICDFVKNGLVQHIIIEDKKLQHFKRNKLGLRAMFTWKNDYKLNIEMIDEEHQGLFKIALKALKFKNDSDLKVHIRQIIIDLNNYMKKHFDHEEDFMKSIEYPGLEEHKILHQNIINQINGLIVNIASMTLLEFEKELLTYIDIWLINHIIFEDKKIMCYYENRQISAKMS